MRFLYLVLVGIVLQFSFINCAKFSPLISGEFSKQSTSSADQNPPGGNGPPIESGSGWVCNASQTGSAEIRSRRLTTPEITLTLNHIFGGTVMADSAVQTALLALPQEITFNAVSPFDNRIQSVEPMLNLTEAVANAVLKTPALMNSLLNCTSTGDVTPCQNNLAGKFGTLVFRRPLTADEQSAALGFIKGIGGTEGLKWGIVRLLNSPNFLQLFELDDSQIQGARARLSQYETAARIAFRITGAAPDQSLLDAAAAGQLASVDQVRTQTARLISTPDGREHVKAMFRNWLNLTSVGDPFPSVAQGYGISATGFGAEALDEFNAFLDEIIFVKNGDFNALLTDKTAFAKTDRLASVYGLPKSTQGQTFKDERGGIFMRAATLVSSQRWSNPIARGVYFRRLILCEDLPSPPQDIITLREAELGQVNHVTSANRDVVTSLTSPANCQACHSKINPIGFTLERFGPLGEVRQMESIFDDQGKLLSRHPINTVVDDLRIDSQRAQPATGPNDLSAAIVQSNSGRSCFARQVFAQSRLRFAAAADGCSLNTIVESAKSKSVKDSLIDSVANDEVFWRGIAN